MMKPKFEPAKGQYLHASCSNEDVYEILDAGQDENGSPTIDVRVIDLNEILHFDHDDSEELDNAKEEGWDVPLTRAELPEGVSLILRGMQWKSSEWSPRSFDDVEMIVVNGPQGGCYRCCYLLSVHKSPGGLDPVLVSERRQS